MHSLQSTNARLERHVFAESTVLHAFLHGLADGGLPTYVKEMTCKIIPVNLHTKCRLLSLVHAMSYTAPRCQEALLLTA